MRGYVAAVLLTTSHSRTSIQPWTAVRGELSKSIKEREEETERRTPCGVTQFPSLDTCVMNSCRHIRGLEQDEGVSVQ